MSGILIYLGIPSNFNHSSGDWSYLHENKTASEIKIRRYITLAAENKEAAVKEFSLYGNKDGSLSAKVILNTNKKVVDFFKKQGFPCEGFFNKEIIIDTDLEKIGKLYKIIQANGVIPESKSKQIEEIIAAGEHSIAEEKIPLQQEVELVEPSAAATTNPKAQVHVPPSLVLPPFQFL